MQTNCRRGVCSRACCMGWVVPRNSIAQCHLSPPNSRIKVRVVALFAYAARTDGPDVCQDGHGERAGGVACQGGLDEHLLPCDVLSRAVGDHEHVNAQVSSAAIANNVFEEKKIEFQAACASPRIVVLSTRLPRVFESVSKIPHGAQKCCGHDHALNLPRKQTYTQRHGSSALSAWAHGWFMALKRNPTYLSTVIVVYNHTLC